MTKLALLLAACFVTGGVTAAAQNIKGRYVSKAETDGTIYYTLPCTLFERAGSGDLTFDITYKENRDGCATVNFSYEMPEVTLVDSVHFVAGRVVIAASASKIYIEPDRKLWKHRFTFSVHLRALGVFFDEQAVPEVTLYSGGKPYVYCVKRGPWKSYAPVGYKIIEMIRLNER